MTFLINKTITIHMLPNISRSKGNLTMKFGQLTGNICFKNHADNDAGRLVLELLIFF